MSRMIYIDGGQIRKCEKWNLLSSVLNIHLFLRLETPDGRVDPSWILFGDWVQVFEFLNKKSRQCVSLSVLEAKDMS